MFLVITLIAIATIAFGMLGAKPLSFYNDDDTTSITYSGDEMHIVGSTENDERSYNIQQGESFRLMDRGSIKAIDMANLDVYIYECKSTVTAFGKTSNNITRTSNNTWTFRIPDLLVCCDVISTSIPLCSATPGAIYYKTTAEPTFDICLSKKPQTSCTNECSSGSKECSGTGIRTCGNYDTDSCLEWSSVTNCSLGCSNGDCNTTPQPPIPTPSSNWFINIFNMFRDWLNSLFGR